MPGRVGWLRPPAAYNRGFDSNDRINARPRNLARRADASPRAARRSTTDSFASRLREAGGGPRIRYLRGRHRTPRAKAIRQGPLPSSVRHLAPSAPHQPAVRAPRRFRRALPLLRQNGANTSGRGRCLQGRKGRGRRVPFYWVSSSVFAEPSFRRERAMIWRLISLVPSPISLILTCRQ
jgi:hypothetical protein